MVSVNLQSGFTAADRQSQIRYLQAIRQAGQSAVGTNANSSPDLPPQSDEVVIVTGVQRPVPLSAYNHLAWSDSYYENGAYDPSETGPTGPDTVDFSNLVNPIELSFTPTPAEKAVIDKLDALRKESTNLLQNLNPALRLQFEGKFATTGELAGNLLNARIIINPDDGRIYANGGKDGQVNPNGGSPIIEVNIRTLMGYDAAGPDGSGLTHWLFHEVAHTALISQLDNATAHADGSMSPAEHARHERLANDITRALGNAVGRAVLPEAAISPPNNYGYTESFEGFGYPTIDPIDSGLPGIPDTSEPRRRDRTSWE
jgi:hypothetical protein